MIQRLPTLLLILGTLVVREVAYAEPPKLSKWLDLKQNWQRDTRAPIVSLGDRGNFDDTHIFAPMVAFENGTYRLWYCGSTAAVSERVFQLGLAESRNGRTFKRHPKNPVYSFGDGKHSILTPTLLRNPDGSVLRENGKLRMWFSSTWFEGGKGVHTLHETSSADGIDWQPPSPAQMTGVYAPTILKDGTTYRMWYVDVSGERWNIRHAESGDGKKWQASEKPCLTVDQEWEKGRLFYPFVIKASGVFQMWYGSYWSGRPNTTALGFAASLDGKRWSKHSENPVLKPDPNRPWESNYVTSHAVLPLPDGSFRIWYASRKKPPFVNKYFAINTAVWSPNRGTD